MNLAELSSGRFVKAIIRFDTKARKKYPDAYSTQVVSYTNEKIKGIVEMKDGTKHHMTIKW